VIPMTLAMAEDYVGIPLGPLVPIDDWDDSDELSVSVQEMRDTIEREKKIRFILFAFTGLLVIGAPVVSYLYPEAWTLILAAALAFTIGTNLLISVVTVRVEDKADSMEARMVELMESLYSATHRLEEFHTQLDGINIPAVRDMMESIRDEVAPGLNSLEDIDVRAVTDELRRASAFVDTLDMDKLSGYLRHIRRDEDKDKPILISINEADPEFDDYWNDEPDDKLIENLLVSQTQESDKENAVLSRLFG